MPKSLPSPELLRKLLRYEPDTGKLFWRERDIELFNDSRRSAKYDCSVWNKRYANTEALGCLNSQGYKHGSILGSSLRAHRVIFAIYYGYWPVGQIDHINGIRSDNRIKNLRDVTKLENSKNQKRRADNKSGFCGVGWDSRVGKWQARIMANSTRKHLGYFDNLQSAIDARMNAEIKYGYHPNHGRD